MITIIKSIAKIVLVIREAIGKGLVPGCFSAPSASVTLLSACRRLSSSV